MSNRQIAAIALALVGSVACFDGFFRARSEAGEQPDPSAVIGRPFRISDSVKKYCETTPKLAMCEQAMPLIASLRSEPRDASFAAPMEALIAQSMRVRGKDWVQIRSLECRSMHCALEYAVYLDDLDHDVDGDAELERRMEGLGGIVAPERNDRSGKPMMVSVLIWQKRSAQLAQ